MSAADTWRYDSGGEPVKPAAHARTRYAPQDFIVLLWRERMPMLAVFLAIAVLGVGAAALTLKTTYPARATILVSPGQEYAYEPRVGSSGAGVLPLPADVVQAEKAILESHVVLERAIRKIGLARLYPAIGKKWARGDATQQAKLMAAAIKKVNASYSVGSAANSPRLELAFSHEDPAMAALFLNTLVKEYQGRRLEVLLGGTGEEIRKQREAFEAELAGIDISYEAFLATHGVGDFETAKAGLAQTLVQLQQQRLTTESALREAQGQITSLNRELEGLPPETEAYRDANTEGTSALSKMEVELANLRVMHKPDSPTLRAKEREVAAMRLAVASGATTGVSARRVGANPLYQNAQADRITAANRAAGLSQALSAQDAQIAAVKAEQLKLAALEPQYDTIKRRRDALQVQISDFTTREQANEAERALAAQGAENIRVVEGATAAVQGKSLKKLAALAALFFAAFTALCLGLVRMYLRPGLPTPSSASRTLELPVLAYAMAR